MKHTRSLKRGGQLFTVVLVIGCSAYPDNPELNLRYHVADSGRSLQLNWDEVSEDTWYRVIVDETLVDSTKNSQYTIGPERAGNIIRVETQDLSVWEELDLTPLKDELILYSRINPDTLHYDAAGYDYSWYRFNTRDTHYWPFIDFYIDGGDSGQAITINSPRNYGINNKYNMAAPWEGGNCAPDSGYSLSRELRQGEEVALWLSDDTLYNGFDNFARIEVLSADSYRVDLLIYTQTIEGLRWVVK